MIRKTGDKGTFYSGEKGTKKIGVDKAFGSLLFVTFYPLVAGLPADIELKT